MTAILEPMPYLHEVSVLGHDFQAKLAKVGTCFSENGLTLDWAAQAGHLHFNIAKIETILEEIDLSIPVLNTRVVLLGELGDVEPIAWQFTAEGKAIPIAWRPRTQSVRIAKPLREAALARIGAFFVREGLVRTFTVRLRGAEIPIRPGEARLEITNVPARTQSTGIVLLSTVTRKQASTWWFKPDGQPVVMNFCNSAQREHNGDVDEETEDDVSEDEKKRRND